MTTRTKVGWLVPWVLFGGCAPAAKPLPEAPPAPAQSPPSPSAPLVGGAAAEPPSSQELGKRSLADSAVRFDGIVYHDKNESPMVTACVPSGPEQCNDGIDNDCDGRYDDRDCGYATGVLQWTLTWSGDADLNLVVYGPAGDEISAGRPSAAKSRMTLDRSCPGKCAPSNVENAFVSADGPPMSGTYQANVEVKRAPSQNARQPIQVRISGRVGATTWHTDVKLAPFAGAEYRVAFAVGADSDHDGVIDEQDACAQEKGCRFADIKYRGCADQDTDGVPDQIDACPQKTGLSSEDAKRNGCPLEFGNAWVTNDGVKIRKRIEFSTGTAELGYESRKIIADVARAIKARPGAMTLMAVDGHTDGVGDDTANVDLSFKRASAVVLELVAKGVPAQAVEARGFGETRPLSDNESETGRQTNRRVEFLVLQPPPHTAACF